MYPGELAAGIATIGGLDTGKAYRLADEWFGVLAASNERKYASISSCATPRLDNRLLNRAFSSATLRAARCISCVAAIPWASYSWTRRCRSWMSSLRWLRERRWFSRIRMEEGVSLHWALLSHVLPLGLDWRLGQTFFDIMHRLWCRICDTHAGTEGDAAWSGWGFTGAPDNGAKPQCRSSSFLHYRMHITTIYRAVLRLNPIENNRVV